MDYQVLTSTAAEHGCAVTPDYPLSSATTFRIGGKADLLIDIPDADAAAALLRCCHRDGIPYLWIGKGSDLLVGDGGFRGAVLRLDGRDRQPSLIGENTVYCHAGVSLQRLCIFARDRGLSGLEFAYGIPGSVGGAVYMNAGAYGDEIAGVLQSVDAVTPDGERMTVPAAALSLGYRHSALMEDGRIVTGATFLLHPDDPGAIAARMKDLIGRRQDKQPLEYPSAGSFFKRPEGYFAGTLIEQAGLKGYRVGDAQVSEKHAGFVINRGHATAADVRRLCEDVQAKVWELHHVRLEPEVRFVGEF